MFSSVTFPGTTAEALCYFHLEVEEMETEIGEITGGEVRQSNQGHVLSGWRNLDSSLGGSDPCPSL